MATSKIISKSAKKCFLSAGVLIFMALNIWLSCTHSLPEPNQFFPTPHTYLDCVPFTKTQRPFCVELVLNAETDVLNGRHYLAVNSDKQLSIADNHFCIPKRDFMSAKNQSKKQQQVVVSLHSASENFHCFHFRFFLELQNPKPKGKTKGH